MSTPKVSVILPCYNAEKYLRQCVDSILNQSLTDLELICVDDGSTDSTPEILEQYRKADSRVRLLRQSNGGAGAARNNGMRQARGEYLSFLDADDFFEPDMLESAVLAAEQHRADYVVFGSDQYHMDTEAFEEVPWTILRRELPPYMPFSYRQLTDNVFLCFVGWAWDKLYRRSFVEKKNLRFQEQRTTNDMLFVFSALVTAKRIAVVDKVLAHQRRGSGESLSVTREKSWHCFYDALTALKDRLVQEGIFWELEKDYINYSLHFCLWHLNSLAEPSHSLLKQKLLEEWFDALGITGKPESYFWSRGEYDQYIHISAQGKRIPAQDGYPTGNTKDVNLPEAYLKECASCVENLDTPSGFSINMLFDRIRDALMTEPEVWKQHQHGYWKAKLFYYEQALRQLYPEQSAVFLSRMELEFRRAMRLDQLQRAGFTPEEWGKIQKLVAGADGLMGRISMNPLVRGISRYIPQKTKNIIASAIKRAIRK